MGVNFPLLAPLQLNFSHDTSLTYFCSAFSFFTRNITLRSLRLQQSLRLQETHQLDKLYFAQGHFHIQNQTNEPKQAAVAQTDVTGLNVVNVFYVTRKNMG